MTLLAGASIGPAAQWVTLILFIEVARRANQHLGKAQVFTLFYISGAIMVTASQLEGGFHGGLGALWSQFYVQSDAAVAQGIAEQIPSWVAPTDPAVLAERSLFMKEWLPAIGLITFTMIIGRIDNMILGYGLFRIASDIEKLPFPMAPVGAQGILALTEENDDDADESRTGFIAPFAKDDPAGATASTPHGEPAGGSLALADLHARLDHRTRLRGGLPGRADGDRVPCSTGRSRCCRSPSSTTRRTPPRCCRPWPSPSRWTWARCSSGWCCPSGRWSARASGCSRR